MRATSVIFLILSVILAFIGMVTCAIGANLAEEQGVELFDQVADVNNNLIYTHNYSGEGIKKITIEVGECDVNVYGGSETEYIELINFSQGSYDFSSTNLTLSVIDNSNLLKLFAWGSDGINFHGFRHYLKSIDFSDKPRVINIYVTEESAIKQFDLKVDTGRLHMENIRFNFDLTAGVGEGTISLKEIVTTSQLALTLDKGTVDFDFVASRGMKLEAGEAMLDLRDYYSMRGITVKVAQGDICINPTQDSYGGYDVDLKAPNGDITYFGESVGQTHEENDANDDAYRISITAENGNILVE